MVNPNTANPLILVMTEPKLANSLNFPHPRLFYYTMARYNSPSKEVNLFAIKLYNKLILHRQAKKQPLRQKGVKLKQKYIWKRCR
jgi:hypothetical protein